MKIFVKVKPSSKRPGIERIESFLDSEASYVVAVKEPPEDGRANIAVIKTLSEYFNVYQSEIVLVSGFRSRNKVFEI